MLKGLSQEVVVNGILQGALKLDWERGLVFNLTAQGVLKFFEAGKPNFAAKTDHAGGTDSDLIRNVVQGVKGKIVDVAQKI